MYGCASLFVNESASHSLSPSLSFSYYDVSIQGAYFTVATGQ